MKHVEVSDLVNAVPVKLTRREKLLRWADLVRKTPHDLHLYHNLEYMTRYQLQGTHVNGSHSAFEIAVRDPEFAAQGLNYDASIQGILDFFELTQEQAHAFSCDCGGDISNTRQAERIERLA